MVVYNFHPQTTRLNIILSEIILTSCKKSTTPFLSRHLKPMDLKKSSTYSRGPWYTTSPSDSRMISSNRSYVSGAGCRREINIVTSKTWITQCKHLIIWKVVALSNPVEISSMKRTFARPTNISPAKILSNNQQIALALLHYENENFMWCQGTILS